MLRRPHALNSVCFVLIYDSHIHHLHAASDFSQHSPTVSAERVDGPTPGARMSWNSTVPTECVASVRVEFRTSNHGSVVRSYTTTNASETEIIQNGLQCATTYYIGVTITGVSSLGTLSGSQVQVVLEGKICVNDVNE